MGHGHPASLPQSAKVTRAEEGLRRRSHGSERTPRPAEYNCVVINGSWNKGPRSLNWGDPNGRPGLQLENSVAVMVISWLQPRHQGDRKLRALGKLVKGTQGLCTTLPLLYIQKSILKAKVKPNHSTAAPNHKNEQVLHTVVQRILQCLSKGTQEPQGQVARP